MESEIKKKFEVLETHPRPARLGECFYCYQKVGDFHKDDCVLINVKFLYDVKDMSGFKFAEWITNDPYVWDYDQRYFHKNEGTWCTSNLFDQGMLLVIDQEIYNSIMGSIPDDELDSKCICNDVRVYPVKSIGEPFIEG